MSSLTAPTLSDRLLAAFRALIRAEDPNRTYRGLYEYIVASSDGTTVDASPTDTGAGLPELTKIPIRTGIAGATCTPAAGTRLVVGFLNGDPTKPAVFGIFDATQSTVVTIDTLTANIAPNGVVDLAGGGNPIARLGDQVTSFLPPTLPLVGTVGGSPFTGAITIANPITGTITGGSAKGFVA